MLWLYPFINDEHGYVQFGIPKKPTAALNCFHASGEQFVRLKHSDVTQLFSSKLLFSGKRKASARINALILVRTQKIGIQLKQSRYVWVVIKWVMQFVYLE